MGLSPMANDRSKFFFRLRKYSSSPDHRNWRWPLFFVYKIFLDRCGLYVIELQPRLFRAKPRQGKKVLLDATKWLSYLVITQKAIIMGFQFLASEFIASQKYENPCLLQKWCFSNFSCRFLNPNFFPISILIVLI